MPESMPESIPEKVMPEKQLPDTMVTETNTPEVTAPESGTKKSRKKLYLRLAAVFLVIYVAVGSFFFVAMHQPPETFSKIIDNTPMPVFMLLPFRTMWNIARAGDLQPGDDAPNFALSAKDEDSIVRLQDFRDQKPVVLIFGSYT